LGASALELPNMSISTNNTSHIIAGSIASFISSYIAIKYVLKIITTKKFALFAMYCWILGIIVLVT
jgi:undecaprenyl-diphosphatase